MTTAVRGKVVRIGGQQRFFPAISGSPGGALDSATGGEEPEAHDAAMAHVADCTDEQAQELQDALDRRAGARARDGRARDSEVDHRNDFRSQAAGGPDKPASDSRRGVAHDAARGAARVDLAEIFPATAHDARNPHA